MAISNEIFETLKKNEKAKKHIDSLRTSEPFVNEIFETYRIKSRVKEQIKAIELLISQGYTIIDLENNVIKKNNNGKIFL